MTRSRPGRRRPPGIRGLGTAGLACLLALAGCSPDRREAERAVRAYNQAAILAYRTGDLSRLRQVATEKEWRKVLVLVDLKTSNGLVLESQLDSLQVTSVARPGPDLLRVVTRERWRYHDRPLQPGRPAGTVFLADMSLQYDFVRQDGKWKLDQARTLSSDYLEPAGYRPSRGHGPGGERRQAHGAGQGAAGRGAGDGGAQPK